MVELPYAPRNITYRLFLTGNSRPIDLIGDRESTAILVLCHFDGGPMHARFSNSPAALSATNSMPLDFYTIVTVTQSARYMTLSCPRPASLYWYVV